MTTMNFRQEFVLMCGDTVHPNGVAVVSEPVTLFGAEVNNIFMMTETASTYIVYGYMNGQWISLFTGALTALIPKVLILNDTLPSKIKLSVTPTAVAGHIVAVATTYPFRMEDFTIATAPTLAWFIPAGPATYQSIPMVYENASLALTYDVSDNLIQIDKTEGGMTWRKTLTWTGTNLTAVSAWTLI